LRRLSVSLILMCLETAVRFAITRKNKQVHLMTLRPAGNYMYHPR
jgi:hypothetical protein